MKPRDYTPRARWERGTVRPAGTMIWTNRAALGAGGRNGTDRAIHIREMKSGIEQDHEQHPDFALILPRRAAYAPLPQATKAGAAVHPHPITCDGHRRAHSHEAPKGRPASGCRGAPDRGVRAPLSSRGRPRVTCNAGASRGGLNSPLRVTHPLRNGVSPVC